MTASPSVAVTVPPHVPGIGPAAAAVAADVASAARWAGTMFGDSAPFYTLFGYETKGNYLYRCACGDMYVREGTRFMELLTDDTRRPYKRLVGFRKWADDSD